MPELNALNPFYSVTTISFTLLSPEIIRLSILSLEGEEVATLVDGVQAAGDHRVRFDARGLPSGGYICQLRTSLGRASRLLFKQQ